MKLSDLIERLQELYTQHGDKMVYKSYWVNNSDGSDFEEEATIDAVTCDENGYIIIH